jgi:hypothetical protein
MRSLRLFFNALALCFCVCEHSWSYADSCKVNLARQAPSRFPVVFKPHSKLHGARAVKLEAWKYQAKKWARVPLQVDEVDSDGSYVLEEGLPYTKYNDDGFIDANDELSLHARSLGESFTTKQLSKQLLVTLSRWARVDFCSSHKLYLGSILVGESKDVVAPLSFKPLFSRQSAEVETSKYHYRFRQDQPMLIGDVKLKTTTGEKNVFSGSSFLMPLIPKFFLFPTFHFGEDDFRSEIESWRSGPVRSIVAVGAKMRKFFSVLDLHLFSELVFYEDFFQIPTQIEFIFDPSRYLKRGSGLAYILSYPPDLEWKLESNLEPLPRSGIEEGPLRKTAYEHSPQGIFGVRGSSSIGSFAANVRVDEKALSQAPPPYLANRDAFTSEEFKRAWPWLGKSKGSLGVFIEISGVKTGRYDFALDVALSNQAHDEFADFQTVSAFWPDPTD